MTRNAKHRLSILVPLICLFLGGGGAASSGLVLLACFREDLRADLASRARSRVRETRDAAKRAIEEEDIPTAVDAVREFATARDAAYAYLLDASGTVLGHTSPGEAGSERYRDHALLREAGRGRALADPDLVLEETRDYNLRPVLELSAPIVLQNAPSDAAQASRSADPVLERSQIAGVLVVGYSCEALERRASEMRGRLFLAVLVAAAISLVAGLALWARIGRPIGWIRRTLDLWAEGNTSYAPEKRRSDELGEILERLRALSGSDAPSASSREAATGRLRRLLGGPAGRGADREGS